MLMVRSMASSGTLKRGSNYCSLVDKRCRDFIHCSRAACG
jgi:hypothetical protein